MATVLITMRGLDASQGGPLKALFDAGHEVRVLRGERPDGLINPEVWDSPLRRGR